ncbi:hypothetical protein C2G38_2191329 [Gigaspora rosea]|uniref:TLDc domain-containing protein n=1 Tax=Gigaspora rosea TaxID=44941 RepID=A0A397V4S4_9GLOM|nr:hypothetical protein C2G38_2191329 [Gigaspora rosea]
MPGKDIAIKVNPYRQILGSNLWNDISLKFMKFHLGLTADRQNMTLQKIPYKFNLLLRDGFTCEIFHKLCDNIPGTVAIIKVNGTNEILGGYNPLVWTSNKSLKLSITTDSFIFH